MEKQYNASIDANITSCSITKGKSKLSIAYNSHLDNVHEYYQDDPDADHIYIGLEETQEGDKGKESVGILLSIDELEFILKHSKKLIKTLKKGSHYVEY